MLGTHGGAGGGGRGGVGLRGRGEERAGGGGGGGRVDWRETDRETEKRETGKGAERAVVCVGFPLGYLFMTLFYRFYKP